MRGGGKLAKEKKAVDPEGYGGGGGWNLSQQLVKPIHQRAIFAYVASEHIELCTVTCIHITTASTGTLCSKFLFGRIQKSFSSVLMLALRPQSRAR